MANRELKVLSSITNKGAKDRPLDYLSAVVVVEYVVPIGKMEYFL